MFDLSKIQLDICPECGRKLSWYMDDGQPIVYFCRCGYRMKTLRELNLETNKRIKELLCRNEVVQ